MQSSVALPQAKSYVYMCRYASCQRSARYALTSKQINLGTCLSHLGTLSLENKANGVQTPLRNQEQTISHGHAISELDMKMVRSRLTQRRNAELLLH